MNTLIKVPISIEFNPHDIWVGVYWKREFSRKFEEEQNLKWFTFYICIIPTLPIRIQLRIYHRRTHG